MELVSSNAKYSAAKILSGALIMVTYGVFFVHRYINFVINRARNNVPNFDIMCHNFI